MRALARDSDIIFLVYPPALVPHFFLRSAVYFALFNVGSSSSSIVSSVDTPIDENSFDVIAAKDRPFGTLRNILGGTQSSDNHPS